MRKLEHHKQSQCQVHIMCDGDIIFTSYETIVIVVTPEVGGTYSLSCTDTYSATIRKQIGWFLKEYFGDVCYQQMRDIAGTEKTLDGCIRKHAKYW